MADALPPTQIRCPCTAMEPLCKCERDCWTDNPVDLYARKRCLYLCTEPTECMEACYDEKGPTAIRCGTVQTCRDACGAAFIASMSHSTLSIDELKGALSACLAECGSCDRLSECASSGFYEDPPETGDFVGEGPCKDDYDNRECLAESEEDRSDCSATASAALASCSAGTTTGAGSDACFNAYDIALASCGNAYRDSQEACLPVKTYRECNRECENAYDTANATCGRLPYGAIDDCKEECDDDHGPSEISCQNACDDAYADCSDACEGDPSCEASCSAARVSCKAPCGIGLRNCEKGCDNDMLDAQHTRLLCIAAADGGKVTCNANCCDTDYRRCLGEKYTTYLIAIENCRYSTQSWVDSGNAHWSVVIDTATRTTCNQLANRTYQADTARCILPAWEAQKLWNRQAIPCILDCYEASLPGIDACAPLSGDPWLDCMGAVTATQVECNTNCCLSAEPANPVNTYVPCILTTWKKYHNRTIDGTAREAELKECRANSDYGHCSVCAMFPPVAWLPYFGFSFASFFPGGCHQNPPA